MGPRLFVRDAHGTERFVDLDADETWIGRGAECSVRAEDTLVSRKHAVLRRQAEGFLLEDLRSANGVFVNEQRLTRPQLVTANDVIRCGGLTLRLLLDTAPAPTPDVKPPPAESPDLKKERDGLAAERDELKREVVRLRMNQSEGLAARTENETLRRRVDDLTTQLKDLEEVYETERATAQDLRGELEAARADLARTVAELASAQSGVEKGTRRAAQDAAEVSRLKDEGERLRKEIADMARQKEEGWRQVNAVVADLEHLREVVKQQGALLEERRVQLLIREQRPT